MSTAYAYEKISHAVSVLAVGTGSIQERLLDAFLSMGILSKDCFTGRALEEWESIYARASAHSGPDGNYRATLLTLPTDEAVRLAHDIVELEAMLESH